MFWLVLFLSVQTSLCQVCYLGGDVALVLDISESANNVEVEDVRHFAKLLVSLLAGHERSQMSLISVRNEPLVRFTFDDWSVEAAREQFLDVFRVLRSKGNRTHHAMLLLKDKIFTREYGARDSVGNMAILVTDRRPSDVVQTDIRATMLKSIGAIMVIVAIGDAVVNKYASKPEFFIRVAAYNELLVAFNTLKNRVFDCSPCPEGWVKKEDGYCYRLVKTPMPWKMANENCAAMEKDAHLTVFETAAQVKWFGNEYSDKAGTGVWIGLQRTTTNMTYVYLDGSMLDTTIATWKTGFPTNKGCVQYSNDGLMDDDCTVGKLSVCEIEQSKVSIPILV